MSDDVTNCQMLNNVLTWEIVTSADVYFGKTVIIMILILLMEMLKKNIAQDNWKYNKITVI